MKLKNVNGVEFYTFDIFEKTGLVDHMFSTRTGGVSEGFFGSLDLSYSRGDDPEKVTENFTRAARAIGSDIKNITIARQTHGTEIRIVDEDDCGRGVTKERYHEGYDGLITDKRGVMLVTLHADCIPLYFLDPVKKVVALSHAGWRGTVDGMAEKTVLKMEEVFKSDRGDILAGIGPGISGCCFEVSADVRDEFVNKLPFSEKHIEKGEKEGKYYIDLKDVNKEILIDMGIAEGNIEVSSECTKCLEDKFFSHRRMGEERGSMAAFLGLR